MKEEQDYMRDITEIRSMMERSSKFLTLSGWAGIMAGIYALLGAFLAYRYLNFNPDEIRYNAEAGSNITEVIGLALIIFLLAISTAIYFSNKRAKRKGERIWNATAKRLLMNMAVPLAAGGLLILIFISKGLIGLVAPCTLMFYGLALYNASNVTYTVVKVLGLVEIILGLAGFYFVGYGLFIWALGFGLVHIVYGIYIHYKYER